MKKFYFACAFLALLAVCFAFDFRTKVQARTEINADDAASVAGVAAVSPNIVISQFYGGGGLTGAQFTHDFVELFNRGSAAVNLSGWSLQYASAGGTEFFVTPLSNVTLEPGQYYLIQYATNGANGASLPAPDLIAPPITNNSGQTFVPNLSSTSGKLVLVNSVVRLPAAICPSAEPSIVDLVGYGETASCFEGARTANLTATSAGRRNGGGCQDTDNNSQDFTIAAPAPRNRASQVNTCNLGGTLQASGAASPANVAPGGTVTFRVTVTPATTPPSTAVTVVANLSTVGGSASQTFYDDGTNGDAVAGDNIFSFLYTIPTDATNGARSITVTVTDAQARTANPIINLTIFAPAANDNPLLLGNPSNATADAANENNYLMVKPQYSLSYNRSRATANWVAWRLDASWIGSAPRQDDFRPDPDLPAGWYQVTDSDYSGSGYDRGHMTPSGDRTRSIPDNSATFLMTNIVPQIAANNQGPWEEFETYCRTLAQSGNELYIFSGVYGNIGTIAQGKIVVPAATWKVVLVLPNGDNDLQRITKGTRTIGIVVPNQPPLNINAPWRQFRKSVNHIEALTGLNFFSKVPINTQEVMERMRDYQ